MPLPRILCPALSGLPLNPCTIGVTGFEPAASASRTQRSAKLSHTPFYHKPVNKTGNILIFDICYHILMGKICQLFFG